MRSKNNSLMVFGVFSGVIVLLAGIFLFLLKSNKVANVPTVIKLRHAVYLEFYLQQGAKIGLSLRNLPFSIIAAQNLKTPEGNIYAYFLLGTFQGINETNQTINIQTPNGNSYIFKYADKTDRNLEYSTNENGSQVRMNFALTPLSKGDVLSIQWTDARTLSQILSSVTQNPTLPLNSIMSDLDFWRVTKL